MFFDMSAISNGEYEVGSTANIRRFETAPPEGL